MIGLVLWAHMSRMQCREVIEVPTHRDPITHELRYDRYYRMVPCPSMVGPDRVVHP